MDTAYPPFIKANYPNPYIWKSYWFGVLVPTGQSGLAARGPGGALLSLV